MGSADLIDVVGVGNAIVDVLAHADQSFLDRHGLDKGTMSLVDEGVAAALYDAMGPAVECSGGSVANTMAGLAALGGRAAFIGKVRDDELGHVFVHDIRAAGVIFDTPPAADTAPTARSLVVVTPDAQRTMSTFLGACVELSPADIAPALVAGARITYLEGYLWDSPAAGEALPRALAIAGEHGRMAALSLSDPLCVARHRAEFRALVDGPVDVLFANEAEVMALCEAGSFDDALEAVRGRCAVAVLTRSAKGSVVVTPDEVHVIDAVPVSPVVDTTGAGDLYASGFLYGLSRGFDLARCGRLGALAASAILGQLGARPADPLAHLVPASRRPLSEAPASG